MSMSILIVEIRISDRGKAYYGQAENGAILAGVPAYPDVHGDRCLMRCQPVGGTQAEAESWIADQGAYPITVWGSDAMSAELPKGVLWCIEKTGHRPARKAGFTGI